ncbi:MAG: response regulator transcription factor [Methylobacteriaceae bacterium]|nr:response regulator transcription factor [Methylobacteriaceae bacterium]
MRVLLVEDEAGIAEDVIEALRGAGYVAAHASDGEEGWFLGETESYDAIILDLGLPRLDGMSVLKRLRAAGVETPILILTARGAWMERVEGIDAGADDYITKPFHIEELMARLNAILRRGKGQLTATIEVGRLRIDTRRMNVTLDGRGVAVSPLEYRALRYLAANRDRAVPQVELAEHVYESEQEPDSNALEVLVARLRRKLGAEMIATRRGFGYMIGGAA